MARLMFGVVCSIMVLCFVVLPISCLAKDYTVGDAEGWSMNVDYSTWASDKTFAVGDTLVFNYGGGHTVDEVSETDYTSCTNGNSLSSDSSGASSIILTTPGTHYFICGIMGHCDTGMKLAVTVSTDDIGTSPATSTLPSPSLPDAPISSTTPSTLPPSTLPPSTSSPSALLGSATTPLLAPPSTVATGPSTTGTNTAPPFAEASSTSANTPTLAVAFLIGMTLSNLFRY